MLCGYTLSFLSGSGGTGVTASRDPDLTAVATALTSLNPADIGIIRPSA